MRVKVIAHRCATAAAIDGIADQAAPSGIGGINPYFQILVLNIFVQIEITDAGFNQRVVVLYVDLENSVHALQIEDHAASEQRRRSAISEILAGGNRPEGNFESVGDSYDLLHLLDGIWSNRGGRNRLDVLEPKRRI